jgi:hypothetical protein
LLFIFLREVAERRKEERGENHFYRRRKNESTKERDETIPNNDFDDQVTIEKGGNSNSNFIYSYIGICIKRRSRE